MAKFAQGFNADRCFGGIFELVDIELCELFEDLRLLGAVGAIAGVLEEALFCRDDVGEIVRDPGGIGYLFAGVLEVNGHAGRLRRVTDRLFK